MCVCVCAGAAQHYTAVRFSLPGFQLPSVDVYVEVCMFRCVWIIVQRSERLLTMTVLVVVVCPVADGFRSRE